MVFFVQLGDKVILKKESQQNNYLYIPLIVSDIGDATIGNITFALNKLIGLPYGAFCTLNNGNVIVIEEDEPLVALKKSLISHEEVKDNRLYADDSRNQKLDCNAILELRSAGASGEDVIQHLVENSVTFKEKSVYSQEKYVKKKSDRHICTFSLLRPSSRVLCDMYWAMNKSQKILGLRMDSLSQMLHWANVHANSNVLLLDGTPALILGAVLERQGAHHGLVCNFIHAEPAARASYLNLNAEHVEKNVLDVPLHECTSIRFTGHFGRKLDAAVTAFVPAETRTSIEQNHERALKKQVRAEREERACAALHAYTWDSLIVASTQDPCDTTMSLLHWLSPGRPFVVFCRFKEPLLALRKLLGQRGDCVLMELWDSWLRDMQVLPDRTRPVVKMSGSGGYLLGGFKASLPIEDGMSGLRSRAPHLDFTEGLIPNAQLNGAA